METILIPLATQVPVLIALIWFLVTNTKQSSQQMERQSEQFQIALDKIVAKIGERLDRIESDLKTHIIKRQNS